MDHNKENNKPRITGAASLAKMLKARNGESAPKAPKEAQGNAPVTEERAATVKPKLGEGGRVKALKERFEHLQPENPGNGNEGPKR